MAFQSKLFVGNEEWTALAVNYRFFQHTDETGKGVSLTKGGKIMVTVEHDNQYILASWVADAYMRKNGKITFPRRDGLATMALEFTDGLCVDYDTHLNSADSDPMSIIIVISAKIITFGPVTITNLWGD